MVLAIVIRIGTADGGTETGRAWRAEMRLAISIEEYGFRWK